MKNAVILHGTGNTPDDNWFRWLEKELKKKGYKVWLPYLPDAHEPDLDKYSKFVFEENDWVFEKDTILIGHSSGCSAAMRILEDLPKDKRIKKAILVAGFIGDVDYPPNIKLKGYKYNFGKIKSSVDQIVLIHSDDDPYVDLKYGKEMEAKLDAKLVVLKGQGHFSVSTMGDRYKEFPELLRYL